jgi:hypothetical protein
MDGIEDESRRAVDNDMGVTAITTVTVAAAPPVEDRRALHFPVAIS